MKKNVLGNALQKALAEEFVWKGEKRKEGDKFVQDSVRFVDMTNEELQKCYNHCNKMLYNEDPKNPGRYKVLVEVKDQIDKCNRELMLRYFENSYMRNNRQETRREDLYLILRELKNNNPQIEDWSNLPLSKFTSNLPSEFNKVSVDDTVDACLDYLGSLDKSHLTMTFIAKMGLWFTKAEEIELKAGSNLERLKLAKEKLHLPQRLNLRFSDKGLSYHEMKAMLSLPKRQRYKDMTNEQLSVLRNKILPRYQKEIDTHIYNWNTLKKQIEIVAKQREFTLVKPKND